MKNVIFLSVFVCCIALIYACQDKVIDSTVPNSRIEFLQVKDPDALKSSYRSLSNGTQKELWIDKLHQIQSQNLSTEQLSLIKALEVELLSGGKFSSENEKIKEIGVKLAYITPKDDFLNMFVKLENYQNFNNASKEICDECIADLQAQSVKQTQGLETRAAACNCKWTCSDYPKVTTNCQLTTSGCGFLWLSTCTGRAYITN
jgi:hypothetical protein